MIQFDLRVFFRWVVQPPTKNNEGHKVVSQRNVDFFLRKEVHPNQTVGGEFEGADPQIFCW